MAGREATMTLPITALKSDVAHAAFTLIELLLVLALLAIVVSFAAPTLGNFFRGRSLDLEGRRLLALTHHGQSRAVSEGIPMMLWLDAREGKYGVEAEPGWDEKDARALEFHLAKDLELSVINTNTAPKAYSAVQFAVTQQTDAQRRNLPEIRFLPDGSIDDTSPQELRLKDRDGSQISLGLSTNRLKYEIQSPQARN
jgi:type II secretion system protein H